MVGPLYRAQKTAFPVKTLVFCALIVLAGLAALPRSVGAANNMPSLADLAERLRPSVVNIRAETVAPARQGIPGMPGDPWSELFRRFFEDNPFFEPPPGVPERRAPSQKSSSLGSGFIIDKSGLILTNNHVISAATSITVVFDDKKTRKAAVVGRDPRTDLALLRVELKPGEELPAVNLGNSDKLRVGDWVMAIGNPFGLSHTVTAGIVSAKGRIIGAGPYDDFIQTDASINPGNSGGPLFDLKGNVVGINTAIFSRSGGNIGIGFAIPVNVVKKIIPQLRTGTVTREFLGVSIQPWNEKLARRFGLEKAVGALVRKVVEGGPAMKAGVKQGDIITSLNGKKISDFRSLSLTAADLKPGSKAVMEIIRQGKKISLTIAVGKLPSETLASRPQPQSTPSLKLGLRVTTLTPETARRFQSSSKKGVIITGIQKSSPADNARLRPGDVIVEVNHLPIESVGDFHQALKKGDKEGHIFLVERRGNTRYVPIDKAG
ncbi:MAG: DegQ family serine endoprotease [bacterium]|nr:DegQ family serine endoprotease [bacterium]